MLHFPNNLLWGARSNPATSHRYRRLPQTARRELQTDDKKRSKVQRENVRRDEYKGE